MFQFRLEYLKKAPLAGAFLFAGLFPSGLQAQCETQVYDESAKLERVYDGDTVRLTDGRKIRLIAVNTPELGRKGQPEQALAQAARQALKSMFQKSRRLRLRYGRERKDRYGRILAHIFTEQGVNVAAALITQGLGFAITVPPNDWRSDCYFKLEDKAAAQHRGLWALADYRPVPAHRLTRKMTGFQRVEGRVSRVGQAKKSLWLDFGRSFSVRVDRRNLQYFQNRPIENLTGKRIRVRGWVSYYNRKLRMSVKHPKMMEILD